MSFEAKYPGYCENCESRIHEGDAVKFVEDVFVHVSCEPKPERKTETCTECWLIKPCECDS